VLSMLLASTLAAAGSLVRLPNPWLRYPRPTGAQLTEKWRIGSGAIDTIFVMSAWDFEDHHVPVVPANPDVHAQDR